MPKKTIWVNTIVHNEENFVWFAIMSVVDFVDKVLVWDTGSNDKTVEVIKEIIKEKGNKVEFKEVGSTDKYQFTKMRQAMLEQSKCDWILVLDGDEVWWDDSIRKVIKEISKNNNIDGIVVPMIIPVGDIYHFQEESAGQYELLGRKGHLSLRAINRKIPNLHVDWPYGKESYLDGDNKLVQERPGISFLDAPYLHATHLKRSNQKRTSNKFKYELGDTKEGFRYPEVLHKPFPAFLPSPWIKISGGRLLFANLLTPLRKIKRRFS